MQNLTAKIYSLKLTNRKTIIFLYLLGLFSFFSFDRKEPDWQLISALPIPDPQNVSTDPYGFIYFTDERGNVYKSDNQGKNIALYSPQKNSKITLLDGWRNVNIFLFYQNFQEFKFLNRFLNEISSSKFTNKDIGFVRLACQSADNNIWLIDDNDYSLKKLNITFNKVEINNSIQLILPPSDYDFTYMREYDNNLYIADKSSGILVFDNMGNYKTKIPGYNISFFSFFENIIYFISNDQLILLDLKTGAKKTIDFPHNLKVKQAILDKNKAYLFLSKELRIYSFSMPQN